MPPASRRGPVLAALGAAVGDASAEMGCETGMSCWQWLRISRQLWSGRPGRPRSRPDKVHADKAYDARPCRQECRARGIVPCIARKGIESSGKLGRHRGGLERIYAWLNRFSRLPVCYERRADIYKAFTILAARFVSINKTIRLC